MRLRDIGLWIGLTLGGIAPAAAHAPAPAAAVADPRPAIWVIEDADTRIYLFGTVHVFPAALRWRSPALDRVIAEADELVMETPDAGTDTIDVRRLTAPMQLGKAVPILERVSPAARGPLRAALEATGVPLSYYDRMTTWGVAFTLLGRQARPAGDDAQGRRPTVQAGGFASAEDVLGGLFRKARKPISGVESIEDQVRVFSTLPLSAQRTFLESLVLDSDEGEASTEAPDGDWVRGDVDGIAGQMRNLTPVIYQALLVRRNRNWTEWLARRMERPGTVLFAVGAGHLAGPDSVQSMLAARGIQARRID